MIKAGINVELPDELSRTAYRASKWEEMEATKKAVEEAEARRLAEEAEEAKAKAGASAAAAPATNQGVTIEDCDDDDRKLVKADVDSSPEFLAALNAVGPRKSRKTTVIGYAPEEIPVRFSKQLTPIAEVSQEEPASDEKKRAASTGIKFADVSPDRDTQKQDEEISSPKISDWKIH